MAAPFTPTQVLERRKTLGMVAGSALVGGSACALLASLVGDPSLYTAASAAGAVTGAAIGRRLARRVSLDPFEPIASGRSYVGAHSPDADGSASASVRR